MSLRAKSGSAAQGDALPPDDILDACHNGPIPVVGLGVGSGGYLALFDFVQNLPQETALAYVVVSPHALSRARLARLRRASPLPVVEVASPCLIEPDHLYFSAPGCTVQLVGDLLQPAPLATNDGASGPLDRFFTTQANERGATAVAVLLAGKGSDGLAGLQAVKAQQGWTLVQAPERVQPAALLRRAIASGGVDTVASASELVERIVEKVGMLAVGRSSVPANLQNDENIFLAILAHLQDQTGHDFSVYKESMLQRRIARRMQIAGLSESARYLDLLHSDQRQIRLLYKDCLVSVTNFFRDPDAFDILERDCVPQLFDGKSAQDIVRVWVAGCASGEEAYSVAILLAEHAARITNPPRLQIFATDVDEEALDTARLGLYPMGVAADIAPARLHRYFVREEGGYRIKPHIRELVLFATHNLCADPPFSRLDLVCCRNLLIYFRREIQEKLIELLHYALNSNGYLFLGAAESADMATHLFTIRNKRCHLYQRREPAAPWPRTVAADPISPSIARRPSVAVRTGEPRERSLEEQYQAWTLRRFAPPRLLVDDHYEITHLFGGADRYLRERDGAVTQNVLHKVLPELRLDLGAALYQATANREHIRTRWLQVELEGTARLVQLDVGPVEAAGFPRQVLEVIFLEQEDRSTVKGSDASDPTEVALVAQLEEELLHTRERLQTIIDEHQFANEELTTSNEELQSINEELKSTTEELEVNKEELQSINEELAMANYELKSKIDELSQANSDLLNFITSTEVGVIFLDRGLRVKRFTPRATDLFHLIEGDIGRPFAHITHRLRYTRLNEQAAHVLERLAELNVLIESEDERWFSANLLPYRTVDNRVDGVVITLLDITEFKRAEYELQRRLQQQVVAELGRQALEGADLPVLMSMATARVADLLDAEICQLLALQPNHATLLLVAGHGLPDAHIGQIQVPTTREFLAGYTLQTGEPVAVTDYRTESRFALAPHLIEQGIISGLTVIVPAGKQPYGVLGVHSTKPRTFTQQETDFLQAVANVLGAAIASRAAEAHIHFQARLLDAVEQAVIATDLSRKVIYWNRFAESLYGWRAEEAIGKTTTDLFVPADQQELATNISGRLRQGESWSGEFTVQHRNGRRFPVEVTNSPIYHEDAGHVGVVGISFDISERKQAEQQLRESERRFRTMADTAPVLIWTAGPDGLCDFFNEPWLRFTGRSMEQELGNGWVENVHPDDLERCLDTYHSAFAARQPFEMEYRLRRHDGEYHWIVENAVPRFEGEQLVGYIGSCTDIHDLKEAEADLRFLADLSERLRRAEQIDELVASTTKLLCDYLDATHCSLAEIDEDKGLVTILPGYQRDGVDRFGVFPLAQFQIPLVDELRAGRAVAVADARTDPRTAEQYETLCRPFGVVAYVAAPLIRDGRLVANFGLIANQPRQWDEREMVLVQTATLRLWSTIEKLRLDAELRASEAELRLITNALPGLIAYVDADERYQFVNTLYEQWFNRPTSEIIGHSVFELLGEKVYQRIKPSIDLALAGETTTFENEVVYADGPKTVLSTYVPNRTQDGRVLGFYALITDISQRKRAEQGLAYLAEASAALAGSLDYEQTLETVARLAVPTIADWCAIDLLFEDGHIEAVAIAHVDPAKVAWAYELRKRYPMDPSAPTGVPRVIRSSEVDYYPVITDEMVEQAAKTEEDLKLLRSIGFRSLMTVPLRARDRVFGAITFVATESSRYFSESDLAIAQDVARRAAVAIDNALLFRAVQQSEQALRSSEERLERHVEERTLELARSNRELDQFAYVASHDLKAPLRGIAQLATWISEDGGEQLSPKVQAHLTRLHNRVRRMSNLLDDLLTFSRAGRIHHQPEQVETAALLRDIVETLSPPAGFTIEICEPLPVLHTERIPLEIVLRNLIGNAIKHHDRADGRVTISAQEAETWHEFAVTDDGPGIDPQFHERIFEMFETLQPRDKVEGSGMGLAIVRRIVESRGGVITLVSAPGEGATFCFTWPK
jgi:PAS domain S-box-containing protein